MFCAVFKLIALDLPVLLMFFIRTKYGKKGGVVWRWEE
jgi:hypothetical protein